MAYELEFGPIPDGLFVLHRCDNRRCVRGDHLFLGTCQDNHDDARAKGRIPKGEARAGAKLTDRQREEIMLSTETHAELARRYSVSHSAIRKVRSGLNVLPVQSAPLHKE